MVSVAEQFGNLRNTLGSILGIFAILRWMRTLFAKLTGRPPPADATSLTPSAFAKFEGKKFLPDGSPVNPPRPSKKPFFFFLAAAFGLPHSEKGEIPVAAIELHAGAPASESDILDWCRQHLAPYKTPRRIWIVKPGEIPQNHTGKVLRRTLQERFSAERNQSTGQSSTEKVFSAGTRPAAGAAQPRPQSPESLQYLESTPQEIHAAPADTAEYCKKPTPYHLNPPKPEP